MNDMARYSVVLPEEGDIDVAYEGAKRPYARNASGSIKRRNGVKIYQKHADVKAARQGVLRRKGINAKSAATRLKTKNALRAAKKAADKATATKGKVGPKPKKGRK